VLQSVITAYIHQEQGYIFSCKRIAIIRPELQDTKGLFTTVIRLEVSTFTVEVCM